MVRSCYLTESHAPSWLLTDEGLQAALRQGRLMREIHLLAAGLFLLAVVVKDSDHTLLTFSVFACLKTSSRH